MPSPPKGPRLGGGPAHERLILSNMATALFEHDRITTTEAKAKRLRPFAERLVTFAKRGDLHNRRKVVAVVQDKGVVHRLFTEIAPDMAEREGGYTRITKIAARKGDNAPMAVIELVREPVAKKAVVTQAEGATRRAARDGGRAPKPAPLTDTELTAEEPTSTDAEVDQAQAEVEAAESAAEQGATAASPGEVVDVGDAEPADDTTEAAMTSAGADDAVDHGPPSGPATEDGAAQGTDES